LKVEANVSATLSVILLPDVLIEEPVPARVHWLFDTVVPDPGVTGADSVVPASLYTNS
jgi:hypothetical protein